MQRYALFAGMKYYANGGWADFQSDHATLDAALAAGKAWMASEGVTEEDAESYLWWHVVDMHAPSPRIPDEFSARDERGLVIP